MGQHLVTHDPCDPSDFRDQFDPTHDPWPIPCSAHSSLCNQTLGRGARHYVLNDVEARACASVGSRVSKEPDGMTLIPWQAGNPVVWDMTVICTSADSCRGRGIDTRVRRRNSHAQYWHSRYSTQWPLRLRVLSLRPLLTFCVNSAGASQHVLVITVNDLSCSNSF